MKYQYNNSFVQKLCKNYNFILLQWMILFFPIYMNLEMNGVVV